MFIPFNNVSVFFQLHLYIYEWEYYIFPIYLYAAAMGFFLYITRLSPSIPSLLILWAVKDTDFKRGEQ